MKFLSVPILFAAGAVAALSANPQTMSLNPRSSFCGYDTAGNGWQCLDSNTKCCAGTDTISCMSLDSNCCTTGYYCDSDEACYIETTTGTQYCRKTSGSADSTRTAGSQDAQETGGKSSACSVRQSGKALALLPVVMAAVVFL